MPLTGAGAARLYDDHVDAVYALITRRIGSASSPEVVAETFEHALRSWDRFDSQRGTERLFLVGSAVAVLRRHSAAEREHLRSLRLREQTGPVVRMVDPLVPDGAARSPRVVQHEANRDLFATDAQADVRSGSPLMTAVSELAPDDRDIVLLSLWESCSHAAIAEALDLSVGTVRSALGRIRRELKAAISEPGSTA
ncbi:MAG: sigma-70 family RNA polymerase sigma factor [Ilumatobacter sp.]|uniref:RNA polymerase sigma factor n=1 Tax=Ilumatobacter sp. TaxID=1967498 RepID=UPI0032981C84